MRSLAFTHIAEHVNQIRHLIPSKTTRDGRGDRQALNITEIILDQNVYCWSWDLFGMYMSFLSQKTLRQKGHYSPIGLLRGSTNWMDRSELSKPRNTVLTTVTDAPRKLPRHFRGMSQGPDDRVFP